MEISTKKIYFLEFLLISNIFFRLLNDCFTELLAFQRAVKEYIANIDPAYSREFEEFFIGFEGNFGSKHVTPRSLTSRFLGNLICVEGIVSKCNYIIKINNIYILFFN